jgi:hypothetical protein
MKSWETGLWLKLNFKNHYMEVLIKLCGYLLETKGHIYREKRTEDSSMRMTILWARRTERRPGSHSHLKSQVLGRWRQRRACIR